MRPILGPFFANMDGRHVRGPGDVQPFETPLNIVPFYSNRIMEVPPLVSERRRTTRLRTGKGAAIRFGSTSIECTIRDLSEGGAALAVKDSNSVPGEFILSFPGTKTTRSCRVIWRAHGSVGVQFDEFKDL